MGLGMTVGGACRDQGVQLGCMPRHSLLHLSGVCTRHVRERWFQRRFILYLVGCGGSTYQASSVRGHVGLNP